MSDEGAAGRSKPPGQSTERIDNPLAALLYGGNVFVILLCRA